MKTPVTNAQPDPRPFEGRAQLYLSEAARALKLTVPEIAALIADGKLLAVSVLNAIERNTAPALRETPRNTWRVLTNSLRKLEEERRG